MSLPVTFRPEATRDLREARAWYKSRRAGLGMIFAVRAASALDAIGRFPNLYGVVRKNVRAAPIRRHLYIIYYRVLRDRVEVIAVFHGRRDPSALKDRLSP